MTGRFFVIVALGVGLIQPAVAAKQSPEDELRMKERVIALSQGTGSVADLHLELMDGSRAAFSSYDIANGKVMSRVWESPGSPKKSSERTVTDEEVRALLRELVAKQYWTFEGTQFIPDAPMLLFRFYDKSLQFIDYRCDADEYERSPERSAIRSVLLAFVTGGLPEKPGTGTKLP